MCELRAESWKFSNLISSLQDLNQPFLFLKKNVYTCVKVKKSIIIYVIWCHFRPVYLDFCIDLQKMILFVLCNDPKMAKTSSALHTKSRFVRKTGKKIKLSFNVRRVV